MIAIMIMIVVIGLATAKRVRNTSFLARDRRRSGKWQADYTSR